MNPCAGCGSKCCYFFALPNLTLTFMRTKGVPILGYFSSVNEDPVNYFQRRLGIRVVGNRFAERFVLDPDLPVLAFRSKRHGRMLIACSPCRESLDDGRCGIWGQPDRPQACRAMTPKTAHLFLVPSGCRLDPEGKHGEDFSEIIEAARTYRMS